MSHSKRKYPLNADRGVNFKRKAFPESEKTSKLVNAVLAQGRLGHVVVILQESNENPYVTLQNALVTVNSTLIINRDQLHPKDYQLLINEEEFASGSFQNIQYAKRGLAEEALKNLRERCFFILQKKGYVNVTKRDLGEKRESGPKSAFQADSVAHRIMMKMGWTPGGGLGAQEQGVCDSISLQENVDRQGFGSTSLVKDLTTKLEQFSQSSDVITLVFGTEFSKEERALIHRLARKFNLKSKSTGMDAERKLTVSKKITRIDIVRELLKNGGEDGLYKLQVPTNFMHLWT